MILFCMMLLNGSISTLLAADIPEEFKSVAAGTNQLLVMLHLPSPHFRPDNNYNANYRDDNGRATRRRIAQELARSHGLKLINDWPIPVLGIDCYVMEQIVGAPIEHVMQELEKDSRVEWLEPMNSYRALGQETSLYQVQPSAKFWHIAEIHKYSTGRDISVALIDSGVDDTHPNLIG